MSKSDYLEDKILDHVLGGSTFTQPANLYLALFTASPEDDDSGTEVSGGAYARKIVTFNASASSLADNDSEIEFDIATASWGTVTHFGIYDAITVGNLIYWGTLGASITVGIDNQVVVPIGELTVSED